MKADNLIYLAVKKLQPAKVPPARKIKSHSDRGEVVGDFAALLQSAPCKVVREQKAVTGKPGAAAAIRADENVSSPQKETGLRVERVKQNSEDLKTAPVEFTNRQLHSIQPKSAIGKAINQTTEEHLSVFERPVALPLKVEQENPSDLEPTSPANTANSTTLKPVAGAVITPDIKSERTLPIPVELKPTVPVPGIVQNNSRSIAAHPKPVLNEAAIPAQRAASSIPASPGQSSLQPIIVLSEPNSVHRSATVTSPQDHPKADVKIEATVVAGKADPEPVVTAPIRSDFVQAPNPKSLLVSSESNSVHRSATVTSPQDHPKADVKTETTVIAGKADPEPVVTAPIRSDFVQVPNQKPNQIISQQGISTQTAANSPETLTLVSKSTMKGVSDVTVVVFDHPEASRVKNIAAPPTIPIVVNQTADPQSKTVEAVALPHSQISALPPNKVTQAAPAPQPVSPHIPMPVVLEASIHKPMAAQPVLVKHATESNSIHTVEELVQHVVKTNPEGLRGVDKPAGKPDSIHPVVSETAAQVMAPEGSAKSDHATSTPPKSGTKAVFNPAQPSLMADRMTAVPVFPETVNKKEGTVVTPDLQQSNRSSEAQPAVSLTNQPDPAGYQHQSGHRDGDPADSKGFAKTEDTRSRDAEPQVAAQPAPGSSSDAATAEKIQPPEAALKDWLDQMPKDPLSAIHRIQNFKDLADKIQAQAKLLKIGEIAELRITLTPPNLGSLLVQIEAEGKDLKLHITTERHEATTALVEVRTELTSIIAAQGYNLSQCEIESRAQQNRWTPQANEKHHSYRDQDGSQDKEHASPDGKNGEPQRKLDLGYNTFDLVA